MSVYVDPLFAWPKTKAWPYGTASHMYADTPEELHAFAESIGLKRQWCSDNTQPGSRLLHYDLAPKKRQKAVALGAIEVDYDHGMAYSRTIAERKAEMEAKRITT